MNYCESKDIYELSMSDVSAVNGGWAQVAIGIVTVIGITDAVIDFANGFSDGYNA